MSLTGVLVKEGINLFKFRRLNRFIHKWVALVGAILLCFVTALLVDWEKYWSATFTALLVAATLIFHLIKHLRQASVNQARQRQEAANAAMRAQKEAVKATKRAAAATARAERIDKTKQAVAEAAKTINGTTGTVLNAVKNGFEAAVARTGGTIKKIEPFVAGSRKAWFSRARGRDQDGIHRNPRKA